MNYDSTTLMNGLLNQKKAQETPSSFSTEAGVTTSEDTGRMDVKNQRMAGQEGARFVQMMLDPAEQARTKRWMDSYSRSNEGFQFNQAKMMMAGMMPAQQEGNQS
jgi:hypothetical protein